MQCLNDLDAEERRDYYHRNGIGYVSRPPHGKDGFVRKGRFKKASNMNFALALSLRVEELLDNASSTPRSSLQDPFETSIESDYKQALQQAVAESNGRAQAAGDIRMWVLEADLRAVRSI